MAKNLVIVESPAKTKSIGKYLGSDFKVVSSKGHIRDLATTGKFGLGVDIENHFKPNYVTIKGKKKVIDDLKTASKSADFIYLATDPDREGEAISWHLYDALGLKDNEYDRIVFNEITPNAVRESLKHARKIDQDLVNSQETRRILDRIIGFRLSKLMQYKTSGKAAGRVQSVALKLIVDREREIEAFKEEEYWSIDAIFEDFKATVDNYKGDTLEIKCEEEANKIINSLNKEFIVSKITKKSKSKNSKPPFTTSTLQQAASNILNMNATKTMMIAQKLYEGIELGNETVGLISYMRTDSTRLSNDFINDTFKYIEHEFGKKYVGVVKKSKNTENVQDAHEAIRPTSIERTPISVKQYLTSDEYKLYCLIYARALSSLMAAAKTDNTTILLDNNSYEFKATGQVITFDGYLKVYSDYESTTETILPTLNENDKLMSKEIIKEQHFTQPPARYTEAKLVAAMEEDGIGRPSTYAPIMNKLKSHGYVNIIDKKFVPTETGIEITDKLQEYFSHIINVKYTSNMETDLDKIAEGNTVWYEILDKFYKDFEPALQNAFDSMQKEPAKETGEKCPECGNMLVVRKGRFGEFVACSNYPKCKYVKSEPREVIEICDCPNCDGKIVQKNSRKGKIFYGCNNYPKCKSAYWDKPTGEKCPNCGSLLTEKKDKIKCSNCDYEKV
jgi:DNA topoisomerase-1